MSIFLQLGGAASALMGATPWGAIAGAAGGLLTGITGMIQKNKANKSLKNLQYPEENIPTAITQNKEMATLGANTGLPSEQYNNAMKNIQRQQMASLSAAQDRRGGLLTVAGNQQAANDALGNLDARDAMARMQNQKLLYGINNQYGNWQNKVWQHNVADKYNRDYSYAQSLLGAGNQNFTSGIDKLTGGAMMGLGGGLFGGGGKSPFGNARLTNNYSGGVGSMGMGG